MRSRATWILVVLVLLISQMSSQGSTAYRYAAVCNGDLFLISANGSSKLILSKNNERSYWYVLAISPYSGTLIAASWNGNEPLSSNLYEVNPLNGKKRYILSGKNLHITEYPVWLNDNTCLLEICNIEGLNAAIYAANIKNGKLKQVAPAIDSEFSYDCLILSPSKRYLATAQTITAAGWVSVNNLTNGNQVWCTNSAQGMHGFTGIAWSVDSKLLFASFLHDTFTPSDAPGGLWKIDALTGKRRLWKYARQNINGIWASPNHKILALDRMGFVEYLRASDGKTLFKVATPKSGQIAGVFFSEAGRSVICGTLQVIVTDLSGKRIKAYDIRSIASDRVKYSPKRNAVMYQGGVLDLRTGSITKFAGGEQLSWQNDWQIEWLSKDIIR